MSEILLMKTTNREGSDRITAHENSQNLAKHLWRNQPGEISWIIKLEGVPMWPPDIRGVCVPKIAKELDVFGSEEKSKESDSEGK